MDRIGTKMAQVVHAIDSLDLDCIKFKLMDKRDGEGWARERADRSELEYRRYLKLVAKYPETAIVPGADVDKFWHGHILDTQKYAQDCEQVFGFFLHHFPYFGMRGEEDAANFAKSVEETRRLYEIEFFDDASAQAASYCSAPQVSSYCSAPQVSSYCSAPNGRLNANVRPTLATA